MDTNREFKFIRNNMDNNRKFITLLLGSYIAKTTFCQVIK